MIRTSEVMAAYGQSRVMMNSINEPNTRRMGVAINNAIPRFRKLDGDKRSSPRTTCFMGDVVVGSGV